MKTTPERPRRQTHEHLKETPETPPRELLPLLVEDDDITYPDTPKWRNLGATARWEFAVRRESTRSLRIVRLLAAAAALVVIVSVAALHLRSTSSGSAPVYARTGDSVVQSASTTAPNTGRQSDQDAIESVLADINALANQFDLDYVALELVRSGTVRPDETSRVDQILESYEIDAVEVFLTSTNVL